MHVPTRSGLQGSPDFDASTAISTIEGIYNVSATNDVIGVRDGSINMASEDVLASRLLGMSILEARLAEGAEVRGIETTAAAMGCSVSCFPRRRRSGVKANLLPLVTAIRPCKLQQQHHREQQLDEEAKAFAPAFRSLHATLPSPRNQDKSPVPDRLPVFRDLGSSFATVCSSDFSDSAVRVHPRPRSCTHMSMVKLVDVDLQRSDVEEANTAGIRPEDDAGGVRGGAVFATKKNGERSPSFLRRCLGRTRSRSRKYGRRQGSSHGHQHGEG